MNIERTLSIIKPNAVEKNVIGEILSRFETNGLRIAGIYMTQLTREKAEGFYIEHKDRVFFKSLIDFMIRSPVILLVLEGLNAVALNREIMGATDPASAADGSIRKDFGKSIEENAVHGSDSLKSAEREVAFFFNGLELKRRF